MASAVDLAITRLSEIGTEPDTPPVPTLDLSAAVHSPVSLHPVYVPSRGSEASPASRVSPSSGVRPSVLASPGSPYPQPLLAAATPSPDPRQRPSILPTLNIVLTPARKTPARPATPRGSLGASLASLARILTPGAARPAGAAADSRTPSSGQKAISSSQDAFAAAAAGRTPSAVRTPSAATPSAAASAQSRTPSPAPHFWGEPARTLNPKHYTLNPKP